MAWPGDELAAEAGGRGRLRASHADREQVVGILKAAFVAGMLAKDEFDVRVGQALASRTYAQLGALMADLPSGMAAASLPEPAQARSGQLVQRPGQLAKWATMLYAGVWGAALLSPHHGDSKISASLVLVATFTYVGVLMIAVAAAAENRRDRRTGVQRPRGQAPGAGGAASRRLPAASSGEPFRSADPGHRHTAEARRRSRPPQSSPVRGLCAGSALAVGTAPAGA
jgi:hypothetical protein